MPLMHGKSKKAFSHNVRTEMEHGKPQKQSIAIAYSMARKRKKASGGMVKSGDPEMDYSKGGRVPEKGVHNPAFSKGESEAGEYVRESREGNKEHSEKKNERAKMEHESVLQEMKEMPAPKLKAEGGDVEEPKEEQPQIVSDEEAKKFAQGANFYSKGGVSYSKMEDSNRPNMAEGGFIGSYQNPDHECCNHPSHRLDNQASGYAGVSHPLSPETHQGLTDSGYQNASHEMDMIHRAMKKHMSKGGQVANDVGEGQEADKKPNEFDDLVLDDGLEFSETGENEGDSLGDPDPDKKKNDLVSRAMLKKKAKR